MAGKWVWSTKDFGSITAADEGDCFYADLIWTTPAVIACLFISSLLPSVYCLMKFLLCVLAVAGSSQADPPQSEHLPSAHCWTLQNFWKGRETKEQHVVLIQMFDCGTFEKDEKEIKVKLGDWRRTHVNTGWNSVYKCVCEPSLLLWKQKCVCVCVYIFFVSHNETFHSSTSL